MIEILTVCTGNVCRSPLAATMLGTHLSAIGARVTSAGTYGLVGEPMTEPTKKLAREMHVTEELIEGHRASYLTEQYLASPDLILAMSREHRRRIVELNPSRLRSTFTLREFARLAAEVSDQAILESAENAGSGDSARFRSAISTVIGMRGLTAPPADPADDDIVDPYRRSWETYQECLRQLAPGVEQVRRIAVLSVQGRESRSS